MNNSIYTICYNSLDVFENKEKAIKYFKSCYEMSEGAEHERYASILIDLNFSNIGKDNISSKCNEINIIKDDSKNNINIHLDDFISLGDAIKYYEDKIFSVLKVSEDYSINFNGISPFEDFGSDEESNYMSSFSKYYSEILNTNLIENIETNEISDGKYEMEIYPSVGDKIIIDVRAWDKLADVLENVKTIEEELHKVKNQSNYFYNSFDDKPVTIKDVHNLYETNSKDITSYESGFDTFEKYLDSLSADLIPITEEEYNGLLNGTHEYNGMSKIILEKKVSDDLGMGG